MKQAIDLQSYFNEWDRGIYTTHIIEECWESSPVKVCVTVDLRQVCAELYVVGRKLAEVCTEWERDEARLTATIAPGTINVGIWKLEKPVLKFEHNLESNEGNVKFTAKLFRLTSSGFKKVAEWHDEEIIRW